MPLRLLQIGFIRSGNYWLWKTLQTVFRLTGLEQRSFIKNQPIYHVAQHWDLCFPEQAEVDVLEIYPTQCFYSIPPVFRMAIEDIQSYLGETTHVWTHSDWNKGSEKIFSEFDKIIYIVRDPRDVFLSIRKFYQTPLLRKFSLLGPQGLGKDFENHLTSHFRSWGRHVAQYLLVRERFNIFFLFYERLLHHWEEEISRLLNYLEIPLDRASLQTLKEETRYDQMKKKSPHHLRRGKWGEWEKVFPERKKRLVFQTIGPLLQLLNYPFDSKTLFERLSPHVPKNSNGAIQSALKHLERKQPEEIIQFAGRILKNPRHYF